MYIMSKDLHVLFVSRFFEVTFRLFSYPSINNEVT